MDSIKNHVQKQYNKSVGDMSMAGPSVMPVSTLSSTGKQKKIPNILMRKRKVTRLPSNFVVNNQEGKFAIQNTEILPRDLQVKEKPKMMVEALEEAEEGELRGGEVWEEVGEGEYEGVEEGTVEILKDATVTEEVVKRRSLRVIKSKTSKQKPKPIANRSGPMPLDKTNKSFKSNTAEQKPKPIPNRSGPRPLDKTNKNIKSKMAKQKPEPIPNRSGPKPLDKIVREVDSEYGLEFQCLICETLQKNKSANTTSEIEEDSEDGDVTNMGVFQSNSSRMVQHIRSIHSITIHMCYVCKKLFFRKAELAQHMESEHPNSSPAPAPASTEKVRHKDISIKKDHICTVCYRKFGSKKLLEEHNNIHIGVKPYACEKCGKTFSTRYNYKSHCKIHTDRPRLFACSLCGRMFYTLQNIKQHEKSHLNVKDFVCNICGMVFDRLRNLQSHKKVTHPDFKQYKCDRCDKGFKRQQLLEYHIRASHTGERPYKCKICKATFVCLAYLKKHNKIHSGVKPYTCEVCSTAFKSIDERNRHRFIHSDLKPFECLDCGAGFMRKPLLFAHMQQQGHFNDTIIINQLKISTELENELDQMEGNILLEEREVIVKGGGEKLDTTIAENADDIFETEFVEEDSKLIIRQGEEPIVVTNEAGDSDKCVVTSEIDGMEDGEAIITGDMIDTQNIHIMDSGDSQPLQGLDLEDGSVRFFQIRLPNGDIGWLALNNTQEE